MDAQAAQERIAHLERTLADVSDEVARQAGALEALERRVAMLLQREAERAYDSGGSVPLADRAPPHW